MTYYEKSGFPEQLIKNLQERSMEKRTLATKQVQQEIEDLVQKNDDDAIARKIEALKRLTEENTQMLKKAGLYGLSSVGVGLSVGSP